MTRTERARGALHSPTPHHPALLPLCRYDDITECFWQRPQLARMLKGLPYLKKARSDKENERFEQEVALKVHCRAILRNSAQFCLTSYPRR